MGVSNEKSSMIEHISNTEEVFSFNLENTTAFRAVTENVKSQWRCSELLASGTFWISRKEIFRVHKDVGRYANVILLELFNKNNEILRSRSCQAEIRHSK